MDIYIAKTEHPNHRSRPLSGLRLPTAEPADRELVLRDPSPRVITRKQKLRFK